jgi:hypothetical protein
MKSITMNGHLLTLVLIFTIFACSPPQNSEQTSQDSTAVDTVKSVPPTDELVGEPTIEEIPSSDTSMLDEKYSEYRQMIADSSEFYYEITIGTNQYEAVSDVTWYYDKSFSPRYFKETWSMEGTEGNTEYIIENDVVVCALVDESYGNGSSTTKWCRQTGGTISTWSDDVTDPVIAQVAPDFSKKSKEELDRYVGILKNLVRESVTSESDNIYIIRLENKVDVGQEVTESTELRIHKKVYNYLK